MGRIVGIDYGLARIGMALSDERKIIASSLSTISAEKSKEKTALKILEALASYQIEAIVIGIPYKLNGAETPLTQEIQIFGQILKEAKQCEIVFWDERLSTVQAEKLLKEANMNRKKRSKVIDAVTATLLLQSYLDKLSLCPSLSI